MSDDSYPAQQVKDGLHHLARGVNTVVKEIGHLITDLDEAKQHAIAASMMKLVIATTEAGMIMQAKKK